MSGGSMVEVENLSVTFHVPGGTVAAVREVCFAVAPGETFGIVGESGSGKSTVLRAIAGLVPAATGRIGIAGERVGQRRSKAQRRALQFVFQDPYGALHPRQTVDRILREPLAIHGIGGREPIIAAALAAVDLSPQHRFRYPHQLSGGQRQRVAIARALILQPKILLLDEPTSALDVSVQAEVLNLLSAIRAERRLTSLLVSHDLGVVAHLCDRIAVMRHGVLVEVLDVAALRAGAGQAAYTRELVAASRGFVRDAARVQA
jgi:peptide/nickel transport system ATP-binding protein